MKLSWQCATVVALCAVPIGGSPVFHPPRNPGLMAQVGTRQANAQADSIRSIERRRLRALVQADTAVANRLHADDFQLINPAGLTLSKAQYLGGIASGFIDYLVWDPDSIAVRLYDKVAVIRYSSHLEIVVQGQKYPLTRFWHTDVYERRVGQWQVVWSQATEIK